MVNISKQTEDSILFEFQNSQHYLYGNGEISVPLNSLQLVIDNSDMVVFKKLDGDPFVSFNIDESNFASKDALVEFYETEMVGGGGIPTEEIQEMIDESIAPIKAETVTDAEYISSAHTINLYNISGTVLSTIDATDFLTDGMLDSASVQDVTISGETQKCLVLVFNTDAGKDNINIPISELFDPSLLQCEEKTFAECEYNQLWSNPNGLYEMYSINPYDESSWNKKFIFKPNFEGFSGKFMYVGFNFDYGGYFAATQHGICPSLNYLISRVLIERDVEHDNQIKDIRVEFPKNQYGAPINLAANVLDDNNSIEINISYNPNYTKDGEKLFDDNYYIVRADVGFLDEFDEETGEPIEYDIEDDSCTSGECSDCLADHWKYYPQGDRSCKLYITFKTLPQESVTDRISRIEDAMISRQFVPLFEKTEEENGTIYGNGKSQNPLADDESCTFVKTPLFNIDKKSIKWENEQLIAPEKEYLDIDGLKENGRQNGAISTDAQSSVNIDHRIIYFELENGCANYVSFIFEGGDVEYGYISVMLGDFNFNDAYGEINLTNGHSYQITSYNLVKKGNEYAIDLGIDNDDSVSTNASVNLEAWGCEDSFVGDIKLYSTVYNHNKIYTTTKKMLDATNLNLDTLENAVDAKEEVISRTFYQLNEAISKKQDVLEAGEGITIVDNVISAEGGGGNYKAGEGIRFSDWGDNQIVVDAVTRLDDVPYSANSIRTDIDLLSGEEWLIIAPYDDGCQEDEIYTGRVRLYQPDGTGEQGWEFTFSGGVNTHFDYEAFDNSAEGGNEPDPDGWREYVVIGDYSSIIPNSWLLYCVNSELLNPLYLEDASCSRFIQCPKRSSTSTNDAISDINRRLNFALVESTDDSKPIAPEIEDLGDNISAYTYTLDVDKHCFVIKGLSGCEEDFNNANPVFFVEVEDADGNSGKATISVNWGDFWNNLNRAFVVGEIGTDLNKIFGAFYYRLILDYVNDPDTLSFYYDFKPIEGTNDNGDIFSKVSLTSVKFIYNEIDDEGSALVDGSAFEGNGYFGNIEDAFNEKQDKLVAGSGITIDGNVISSTGGGIGSGTVQSMIDESISGKVNTSAITSSITSASTETEIPSAKAVYDAIGEGGGGLDEDFLQANANALYELKQEGKATNERFDNYYTKTASDGRYASNASIKKAYYDKAYVDDKLLAISASLNELNDDKQDALVAGSGISISGNVISAEGGGGAEYSAGTNIEITTANTINCTLPISENSNNGLVIGTNNQSTNSTNFILGKNNSITTGSFASVQSSNIIGEQNTISVGNFANFSNLAIFGNRNTLNSGNDNTILGNNFYITSGQNTTYIGCYGKPSASGNTNAVKIIVGDGYLDGNNGQKHYHNCLEINQGNVYIVDTNDASTQDYYSKPMMCLQDVIKDLTDRIAALESQLNNN